MSFILDALKKSEERRQQGQSATSRKHVLDLQRKSSRRWPLWLVLAALLPTALLAGWWLGRVPSPPDPMIVQPPAQQSAATEPAEPAAIAPRSQPTPSAAPASGMQRQTAMPQPPEAQAPPASQVSTGSSAAAPVSREPVPIEPAPIPTRRSAPAAVQEPAAAPAAASQQPLPGQLRSRPNPPAPTAYAELSPELRSRLPQLAVSLHFYSSDPARRMVRIDGRLLHEGEVVAEGLTVHEITPEKTILDYHGRLFALQGPGG